MRKTLLTLCLALIAVFASAQTYFWQEDFSSYAKNDVPAGGTYSYVCVDGGSTTKIYEEALAGGTSPELLVSKSGGSFAATISATGELTLSFQANKKNLNVTVSEGATLGEVTNSGNNFTYPVSVAAGTSSITITFANTSSSNIRLDDIKLFQGEAKKNAGLSWGTASRSVTIGADDNTYPQLSNENNLDVTYSSSNTEVATISADGSITLVAEGTTTISATFDGNDTYDKQTVSYTLTVKAQSQEPTTDIANTAETAYTVAKAVELIEAGEGLSATVFVKGFISKVESFNSKYGSLTYWISDDGTETSQQFECYSGLNIGGAKFNGVEDLSVGASVIVKGVMKKYTPKEGDPIYEFNYNNEIVSISSNINSITVSAANVPAYNIAGQRVNANASGIVVRNGRKYINK